MELVIRSFAPNANTVDIKRANVVVLGKKQVYLCMAQLEFKAVDVPVIPYVAGVSLLDEECKPELK
eukprot:2083425-Amphidinium_carterae.1